MVTIGHKTRPLRDGGGKPSPGRLPPSLRPSSQIASLGRLILQHCNYNHNQDETLAHTAEQLFYNTTGDNPIPTQTTQHIQQLICNYTDTDPDVADGQPFLLNTMAKLAYMNDDPDCDYPHLVADGVNLGVDEDIAPSPGIWPSKEEMRGMPTEDEQLPPPTRHDNYPSASEHEQDILATYYDECPVMVEGPYTEAQAARRCKCSIHELCHGAIAGKPEGRYLDKLRTIHDATVNMVNQWIQQHLHEKTTAPTLHDLLTALHILNDQNVTLLKLDITKAHRRIKIRRRDWKYMTAKIGNNVWINKCGTYGISSAQYYWGRMAALTIRLLYGLFPDVLWAFVYVDDYIFVLHADTAPELSTAIIVTLHALGCPVSWKKTTLGQLNNWLGYQVHAPAITACLTPDKQTIITAILQRIISGEQHSAKEVQSVVGRLQWATAICLPMRPFLQPLYAWMTALINRGTPPTTTKGRPPKAITILAEVMMQLIQALPSSPMPPVAHMNISAATDAGANDTDATIGGWYSLQRDAAKHEVHWFSQRLHRDTDPWAFSKDTPKQCIAAIELYASMLLLKHLVANYAHIDMAIPMHTDNMGNAYTSCDYKCKKWPNSAILMEMALEQHHHRTRLQLHHVHRENNTWADQLTHCDFTGFHPTKRFHFHTNDMKWHLLNKMKGFETLQTVPD